MNLCIDVGNTTINIGLFVDNRLIDQFSLTVDMVKTQDEYAALIKQQVETKRIDIKLINNIIFSSVVPLLNVPLKGALKSVFHHELMVIEPGVKTGLTFKVDNPLEIGNDLIADLVGVKEIYGYPCIIADLGTASKILLLDKDGYFSSALIMPGISISAENLTNRAALLPSVSLEKPKSVLAKNTIEAMNSGILYGHSDMILGLIARVEKELGYSTKHILTGGGAVYIKDILKNDFIFDQNINLIGLNIIINKNGGRYEK
ncbi:MAG TPA: type III pantothenate kinase [Bacilli bacterium]|nr:type III pantothenate kinase [Bacilli bacterium]HPS19105.1 type III pantothenate kinase [Bacilli bacterium]